MDATLALIIIGGVLLLAIIITFFGGRPASDADEKDIEHLDHEARGDQLDH